MNDKPAAPAHDIPHETIDLQIADVLAAVRYQANKDAIVDAARDAGASNEVLSMLDGLPEQDYADVNAVTQWVAGNFGPGLGILADANNAIGSGRTGRAAIGRRAARRKNGRLSTRVRGTPWKAS